jgi:hypothetical protein
MNAVTLAMDNVVIDMERRSGVPVIARVLLWFSRVGKHLGKEPLEGEVSSLSAMLTFYASQGTS